MNRGWSDAARPCIRGSAYTFVLMVALMLFIIVTAALAVTSRARQITAQYPRYANLYELAVAGNEYALARINAALKERRTDIDDRVRRIILSEDIEQHLIYRNGSFLLLPPENENGYYAFLYKICIVEAVDDILPELFLYGLQSWHTTYTLNMSYGMETESGEEIIIADIYTITADIKKKQDYYIVTGKVTNSANGASITHPVEVEAEFIQPAAAPYEELFIPAYRWRDMPLIYTLCLYAGGDVIDMETKEPLYVLDADFPFMEDEPLMFSDGQILNNVSDEPAFVVTTDDDAELDVSILYKIDLPVPIFLLHRGSGTLTLRASDYTRNRFSGVVVSSGNICLSDVDFTGTAMADGNVSFSAACVFTPDTDMLFKIDLAEPIRQRLFDFLGLTRFSGAAGHETDIVYILHRVAFNLDSKNGRVCGLEINNFDAVSLSMVKSKKIAK